MGGNYRLQLELLILDCAEPSNPHTFLAIEKEYAILFGLVHVKTLF